MVWLQPWLVKVLVGVKFVHPFMRSKWGWPICETVHFFGLSLLIGTIGMFDLRLLGWAKRIPVRALHRLVPWGVAGYITNVVTGSMFLMTDTDQYIYNPSFHFKILFMGLAGLNILVFYTLVYRKAILVGSGEDTPLAAKFIGGASLFLWIGVIVFGRMLTFYRPFNCMHPPTAFPFYCIP